MIDIHCTINDLKYLGVSHNEKYKTLTIQVSVSRSVDFATALEIIIFVL